MTDALLGRVLDQKYRIDAEIGAGGMATIYRATRLNIGDTVAIKVLHAELLRDPQFAERFRREAQTAARLKHPNVVAIYDFGVSSDGVIYLVMELVEGRTLRAIVREQGPMPAVLAAEIIVQVCAALTEAHRQKIVHRDIKPANIIVENSPDGPRVKVLDFGIASLHDGAAMGLTQFGDVLGTPAYMSPEQCLGEELDGRSDIYSLGVVLFEMLCGVVPFNSPTATAVVMQHVHQAPPPLRVLNVSVSPAVEAVVLRALAKHREDRFESPRELADALTAAVNGPRVSNAPDTGVKPAYPERQLAPTMVQRAAVVVPPSRAPRAGIATGIAMGAALAILIGAVWFGVQRATIKPKTVAVHAAQPRPRATARPYATAQALATARARATLLPAVAGRIFATAGPSLAAAGEDPVGLVRQYYDLWNARQFAAMYAMLSVRLQQRIPYDEYVRSRLPVLRTGVDAALGDEPGVVNISLVTRDRNGNGTISETYNAGQWFLTTEGGRLKLNELRVHATRPPLLVAAAPATVPAPAAPAYAQATPAYTRAAPAQAVQTPVYAPAQRSTAPSSAVAVVREYYRLWNAHAFDAMYGMLSARMQRTHSRADFAQSMALVQRVEATVTPTEAPDIVNVRVVSYDRDPNGAISRTVTQGQWYLSTENNQLKLDTPKLDEVD